MGSWYGSIQLRTEDRAKVREALVALAVKTKLRFYMGPALGGWMGVYPSDHGQEAQIGHALAKELRCDAFHLILCDDDVFAYNFFREGRLADEYWSCPGYFSEEERIKEEEQRGDPSQYAHLSGGRTDAVSELLQRAANLSQNEYLGNEEVRLRRFAELLGIQNATTAYESLADKETAGIVGRESFEHVPDWTAEKAAKKAQKDLLKTELQALHDRGLLLAEYRGKKDQWPQWCVDHSSGGVLLCWQDMTFRKTGPPNRLTSPWPKIPTELGIQVQSPIASMATSHSGNYLALSTWEGVGLWDLTSGKKVVALPHAKGALSMLFSQDDRLLVTADQDRVRVSSIPDGATLLTASMGGGGAIAIDPANHYLLLDRQLHLVLVPLARPDEQRKLFIGGRYNLVAEIGRLARQRLADIDIGELDTVAKKQLSQITASDKSQIDREVQKSLAAMKEWIGKAKSGGQLFPEQAAERAACFRFSLDGTRLFCGTNRGLRVFRWDSVLAGGEDMDLPEYSYDSVCGPNTVDGYVYAIVENTFGTELLFAGIEGLIRRMNLANGQVEVVLTPPGRDAIIWMGASSDRGVLATLSQPGLGDVSRVRERSAPCLRVWDYARLIEADRDR